MLPSAQSNNIELRASNTRALTQTNSSSLKLKRTKNLTPEMTTLKGSSMLSHCYCLVYRYNYYRNKKNPKLPMGTELQRFSHLYLLCLHVEN